MAWDIAGLSAVCKTVRDGFDSRPRLQFFLEWKPRYAMRDGARLGPFWFSTKYAHLDEQEALVFSGRSDHWRRYLKDRAHNEGYSPPQEWVHLARSVIESLESDLSKAKQEMIAARKEVSRLKRAQPKPEHQR